MRLHSSENLASTSVFRGKHGIVGWLQFSMRRIIWRISLNFPEKTRRSG